MQRLRVEVFHSSTKTSTFASTAFSLFGKRTQALKAAIFEVIGGSSRVEPKVSGYVQIVVRRNEFKVHTMIDVRHFWLPKGKSKLAPSDKGVSIPVEQVEMFITMLQEVQATIQPTAKPEPVYFDKAEAVANDI